MSGHYHRLVGDDVQTPATGGHSVPGLSDQQEQFLREGHIAVVTTLRADGSPHSTVVWVDGADGELRFNTARGRAKERHLLADPRASVTVIDSSDFHRWLTVEGRAILVDEGAGDHIDMLAVRYEGPGAASIAARGERRVIVRIPADRIEQEGLAD
jgi:PPOX class probable F420-dependent enzyme